VRHERLRFAFELAGIADAVVRATTSVSANYAKTPDKTFLSWGVSPRVRASFQLVGAVCPFLALGADFYYRPEAFVLRSPERVEAMSSFPVRPRLESGLAFEL
jgi:hypothetical protein